MQQKSKKFKIGNINKSGRVLCGTLPWSECRDLNPRPLGPEPSAIPNFATPRKLLYYKQKNAGCQALNSKTPEILRFFRKTHGNGAQDAAFPAAGGGFGRGMSRTHEGTRRAAAAHGDPCRATARRDASGGNSARTDPRRKNVYQYGSSLPPTNSRSSESLGSSPDGIGGSSCMTCTRSARSGYSGSSARRSSSR